MADEDPFEEEMERQRKREEKERSKEATGRTDASGEVQIGRGPARIEDMNIPAPEKRQAVASS